MHDPQEESRNRNVASRVSQRLRKQAFERDGHTCQMCGARKGETDEYHPNRKVRLHIGRVKELIHGGTNALDNLRTLCHTCYQGCLQITREPPPSWIQVMTLLRKAEVGDQKKVLNLLCKKFPETLESPQANAR